MTKNEKNPKGPVDAEAHAEDGADPKPEEPVTQFKARLNKYGFVHIPKKALASLPFKINQSLIARIDGDNVIFAKATETS